MKYILIILLLVSIKSFGQKKITIRGGSCLCNPNPGKLIMQSWEPNLQYNVKRVPWDSVKIEIDIVPNKKFINDVIFVHGDAPCGYTNSQVPLIFIERPDGRK